MRRSRTSVPRQGFFGPLSRITSHAGVQGLEEGLRPWQPSLSRFVVGIMPPSTRTLAPVMKSASGLASYATMFATSVGAPIIPTGKRFCCTSNCSNVPKWYACPCEVILLSIPSKAESDTFATSAVSSSLPRSPIAAFGDKEAVFLECLEKYANPGPKSTPELIAEAPSARQAAHQLLEGAARWFTQQNAPAGCWVASAASSGSAHAHRVRTALKNVREAGPEGPL